MYIVKTNKESNNNKNCPIDFKFCMVIPLIVGYDLESEATL